jgi:hypothetical protein
MIDNDENKWGYVCEVLWEVCETKGGVRTDASALFFSITGK